jgi:transposase
VADRACPVVEAAEAAAAEPQPTSVLGIDETRRGRVRWTFSVEHQRWVRTDAYDTGFVDLAGDKGLLGQSRAAPAGASSTRCRRARPSSASRFATSRSTRPRSTPKAVREALPGATLVVDHLRLVKLADDCLTKVRRRVIWEQKAAGLRWFTLASVLCAACRHPERRN